MGMNADGNLASALLTDWYQLSMLDAYYRLGMTRTAVFEFFVRRLPCGPSKGRRLCGPPALTETRAYCAEQLARLPPSYRTLEHVLQAPVKVSQRQHRLADEVARIPH
jgi:hypothetical protein